MSYRWNCTIPGWKIHKQHWGWMANVFISHAWTQFSCGSLSNPFREWTKCLFHWCKCAAKSPQYTWYISDCVCQEDAFAWTLMYSEVPSYCTWNVTKKAFVRRRRGKTVDSQPGIYREITVCIPYTVHPNRDECFFLRMLLVNVPGPKSLQQLKIVDGATRATFRAACYTLKFLENDQQWDICINDACNTAHPNQIRALFAIILSACFPSSPTDLWERYRSNMAQDSLHRVLLESSYMTMEFTEGIYNKELINIEDKWLAIANIVFSQLGMPSPTRAATTSFDLDLSR
jgi:hypothetical protein